MAIPGNNSNASNQQQLAHQQWQNNTVQANQSPVTSYISGSQDLPDKQHDQQDQPSPDPLVNTLAVSTVAGKQPEPILSMHVLQSINKNIWAGEYIDLAIFWRLTRCQKMKNLMSLHAHLTPLTN